MKTNFLVLGFSILIAAAPAFADTTGGVAAEEKRGPAGAPSSPGASLSGRIVDSGGEPLVAEIIARPAGAGSAAGPPSGGGKGGRRSAETRSDQDGRFRLEGLAPGVFDLEAKAPGFISEVVLRGFEIKPPGAVLAEPLVLPRPLHLSLQLLPELDPWGERWIVEVLDPTVDDEPQKSPAGAAGQWNSPPLRAGDYGVRVLDSQGQLWESRNLRLETDGDPLPIAVPVLAVRGRASLGADPYLGKLILQRHASVPGIVFDTDANGRFSGFLPGEGRWLVALESEPGRRSSAALAVEVARSPGKSYATIELEVPATRIVGEVVDAGGRKIADAAVSYMSLKVKSMGEVLTDPDGIFEIFGIAPGEVSLRARKGELESQGTSVTIEENIEGPRQRLVLHEKVTIRGIAAAAGTPQPGVRIVAWPEAGSGSMFTVLTAASGPDGSYELELPSFVTSLGVLAESPDGVRRLLRHAVGPPGNLVVETTVERGELAADLSGWLRSAGPDGLLQVVLVRDGIQLPLLMWKGLKLVAKEEGGFYELGRFESGHYSLCLGRIAADGGGRRCFEAYLPPGGRLVLTAETEASLESGRDAGMEKGAGGPLFGSRRGSGVRERSWARRLRRRSRASRAGCGCGPCSAP